MLGNSKTFFDEVLKMYSQRATEMLAGLVNNERFIQSVQLLLERSLEFRELMQRSVASAFEQMNIPTRHDTDEIKRRLLDVEERLFSMEETLERLESALVKPAAKPARRKAAPRTHEDAQES